MRIDRLQVKEQMAYPVGFYVRNSHFQETASYRGVSVWDALYSWLQILQHIFVGGLMLTNGYHR